MDHARPKLTAAGLRSLRTPRSVAGLLALVMLAAGAFGQSRPVEPLKPLSVTVIDADTEQPITAFEYFYHVAAASGYEASEEKWTAVQSTTGTVVLDLPASCVLTFTARANGFIYPTPDNQRYPIRSTDVQREIKHPLRRGAVVSGRVIDATTREPIASAAIWPLVSCNPIWRWDDDRSALSDPNGSFEITGLDPACPDILVEHADYVAAEWRQRDAKTGTARPSHGITVELKAGTTIFGFVRGPDREPIADASVEVRGRRTQTDADGRFQVRGIDLWGKSGVFDVEVQKEGYMHYGRKPVAVPNDGLQVILEPLFEVRGRVVDEAGQPVKRFSVMAGAGKAPYADDCARADVTDDEGRFVIGFDTLATFGDTSRTDPEHWVSIKADGFATWEGSVPADQKHPTISVTLTPGVGVTAQVGGVKPSSEGRAVLVPDRCECVGCEGDGSAAREFGALTTTILPDGKVHFAHVRPDKYVMRVSGKGITPRRIPVWVGEEDLELGSLELQATGRIVGRIFGHDGQPWEFADGVFDHTALGSDEDRCFMVAEDGTFVLEDVPAGAGRVGARYYYADIIFSDLINVRVSPAETVHAMVNNPDPNCAAKFRVVIGDGSAKQRATGSGSGAKRLVDNATTRELMFRVELEPLSAGVRVLPDMSDCRRPDANDILTLRDVPANKYRLRVFDWLGGSEDGPLYQREIEVRSGGDPIQIPLGAGAITGQFRAADHKRNRPHVVGVETQGRNHTRRAHCDSEGNFCIRFLPPGQYVLYGHAEGSGFCQTSAVSVADEIVEIGSHLLAPGAAIRGTLRIAKPLAAPLDTVRLTDAHGVAFNMPYSDECDSGAFELLDLWPGTWTVAALSGDEVLAQAQVELKPQQAATVDLTIK